MEKRLLGQVGCPTCVTPEEWENHLHCELVHQTPVSFLRISATIWRYRSPYEACFRYGTLEELIAHMQRACPIPVKAYRPKPSTPPPPADISDILAGI